MDIKRKLTSRKFWLAIAGVICGAVTLVIGFVNGEASLTQTITGCILAGASIVAYIIGEGLTDVAAINKEKEDE